MIKGLIDIFWSEILPCQVEVSFLVLEWCTKSNSFRTPNTLNKFSAVWAYSNSIAHNFHYLVIQDGKEYKKASHYSARLEYLTVCLFHRVDRVLFLQSSKLGLPLPPNLLVPGGGTLASGRGGGGVPIRRGDIH